MDKIDIFAQKPVLIKSHSSKSIDFLRKKKKTRRSVNTKNRNKIRINFTKRR